MACVLAMWSRHRRCQRDLAGHHDLLRQEPGSGQRPQFRQGKRPSGRGPVIPIVVPPSTGMVSAPVRGRGHGCSIIISRRIQKHVTRSYAQYLVGVRIKWLIYVLGRISAQHAVCRMPGVAGRDAAAGGNVPRRRLRELMETAGSRTFSATDAGCLASRGSTAGRTADVLTSRSVRQHRNGSMGHVDRGRQAATEGPGRLRSGVRPDSEPLRLRGAGRLRPVFLPQENRNRLTPTALQHAAGHCFVMLRFATRRSEAVLRFPTGSRRCAASAAARVHSRMPNHLHRLVL